MMTSKSPKRILHDRNGNLTTIPQPAAPTSQYDCTYDAWNRLVKVETTAPATIGEYAYDGLNRRIRKNVPATPSYQHFYYNAVWQVLETRQASTAPVPATAQYQYVWSLRYLDAPVLRDDIAAAPDVRLYYSGDANFNVTSLFDVNGTPVESYVYDPYGKLTIYNADWSATRSTSSYDNSTLYTGQWRDAETGLSNYRRRYYDPGLGRFITRDPIGIESGVNFFQYGDGAPADPVGFLEGPNLYAYVGSRPTILIDPSGTKTCDITSIKLIDNAKAAKTVTARFTNPRGKIGYDLNIPGPIVTIKNNKNTAHNVHWVVFYGSCLQDCQFWRYFQGTIKDPRTAKIGNGYKSGGTVAAETTNIDGSGTGIHPREFYPLDKKGNWKAVKYVVVADAPGTAPNRELSDRTVFSYDLNFRIVVKSKSKRTDVANVTYDVLIGGMFFNGMFTGPQGDPTKSVNKVANFAAKTDIDN